MDDMICFPGVNTHDIVSTNVDQTFRIQVARPPRRRSDNGPLPVVYTSDANIVFPILASIASMLHGTQNSFPQFILVGIGYPSEAQFAGTFLRMRDFTTPEHPRVDKAAAEPLFPMEGVLRANPGSKDHGGAEDFRRFIATELIPFIDTRYETLPKHRTLIGHSGGGFFGLYSLLTEPALFQNYLISSPSLHWNGETAGGHHYRDFAFGREMVEKYLKAGADLTGRRVYLSVGGEEEFQPGYESGRLVSSFYQMAGLLRSVRAVDFQVMSEVLAGETHMTAWPVAFIHGVQVLFGLRRLPELG